MAKISNKITILIADIHTLENQKFLEEEEISNFKCLINKILDGYNLDKSIRDNFIIIVGSDFQLNKSYVLDLYNYWQSMAQY